MSKDNNIIDLSKAKARKARQTLRRANGKKNRDFQKTSSQASSGKPSWAAYVQFLFLLLILAYVMTLCSRG